MLGKPCYSQYEIYPISGYFSKLGAHQTMLADKSRTDAFLNALKDSIIPGKSVVLDIGTGTGILAMTAAKLRAKQVFAIESSPIINIAREIAKDNGLDRKIKFIKGYSTDLKLGSKVDIIVSETIGFTGLEENIVDITFDAKKRFGHKNTILIPSQISVQCAPTCDTTANELVSFWQKSINGFDYKKVTQLAKNNLYGRLLIPNKKLLSNPAELFSYRLGTDRLLKKEAKVAFKINNESPVTGFVIWFSVVLSDSQQLDSYKPRNHWQQAFIPIDSIIQMKTSEVINLQFTVNKIKKYVSYAWAYEVYDNFNNLIHGGKGDTANIIKYCTK